MKDGLDVLAARLDSMRAVMQWCQAEIKARPGRGSYARAQRYILEKLMTDLRSGQLLRRYSHD